MANLSLRLECMDGPHQHLGEEGIHDLGGLEARRDEHLGWPLILKVGYIYAGEVDGVCSGP